MKICVSSLAKPSVLAKAAAIKVYKGQNIISLREKYPNATLFIPIDDLTQETIENLGDICFIVKELTPNIKIPFMYYYAINTFEDIHKLIKLGAKYIRITSPLTFQIDKLQSFTDQVKFITAYNSYDSNHLPNLNWPMTQLIRPEDVDIYAKSIELLDISDDTISRNEALFKIYSDKKWGGPLNLLFPEAPGYIDNSLILDNFGERRSNCGLRCLEEFSPKCKYCQLALSFPSLKNRIEKNK